MGRIGRELYRDKQNRDMVLFSRRDGGVTLCHRRGRFIIGNENERDEEHSRTEKGKIEMREKKVSVDLLNIC